MLQFMIMSGIVGFSGNKLFGKDKSTNNSLKWSFISGSVLLVIYKILGSVF
jgi:hypothetical protein